MDGVPATHKLKQPKNSDLAAKAGTAIDPVEEGCRAFMGKSAIMLTLTARMVGSSFKKSTEEEGEKASYWLWLGRREKKVAFNTQVRAAGRRHPH